MPQPATEWSWRLCGGLSRSAHMTQPMPILVHGYARDGSRYRRVMKGWGSGSSAWSPSSVLWNSRRSKRELSWRMFTPARLGFSFGHDGWSAASRTRSRSTGFMTGGPGYCRYSTRKGSGYPLLTPWHKYHYPPNLKIWHVSCETLEYSSKKKKKERSGTISVLRHH